MGFLIDRIHRLPRVWSNQQLAKHAPFYDGDIVNVSGWKDQDKEGLHYRDYFVNAQSYSITNYVAGARGIQGYENEVFLDLEDKLPEELGGAFDVVFNHTTLEHIYDFRAAFDNMCKMTKDTVIIVVPWLQQYHADYGDYWRFSPLAVKRMFEENGFELLYLTFNGHKQCSVYVYAVASRNPDRWRDNFDWTFDLKDPKGTGSEPYAGCRALPNTYYRHGFFKLLRKVVKLPTKISKRLKA